ncbi:MAG: sodium/hydrogen antiporter [Mycobacterium sp.]|nr:sodium/hydrogen antiporter [Mycobacterium sp.]
MRTETAFVLTVLVLCYAVVSGLVKRWYVAPALIFVAFGMALGPFGFGLLEARTDTQSFTILAQLALTVILFNQAAMLDLPSVVRRGHVTFRLLVVGIPLSIVLGTVVALLVMPVMPLWEAVCLAAIVAPTEVALIDALLEDRRIPERVRHALSTESGFYDGFALAAMLAALALASEQSHPDPGRWGWFAVRTEVVSLVVGLAVGVIGGLVIAWSRHHGWMSDTWAQLATLALALVCFEVGERLHGSGFVAAFAGGLAYSMMVRRSNRDMPTQVSDAAGQLLELMVFAMFGGYALFIGWRDAGWRVIVFSVLALIVVRLVAVSVALVGSDLPARSRLFIGWFGPRGIGTLVLGLLMVGRGEIQQSDMIMQAVVVTVTVSLVMHSLTTPLGIRLWPEPSVENSKQARSPRADA